MAEKIFPKGRAVVESPLKAPTDEEIVKNCHFAQEVCRGLCFEGWAVYASHLFYTQFLDDDVELERNMGIYYGLEWADQASVAFMCLPPGKEIEDSKGMTLALERHKMTNKQIFIRHYNEDGTEVLSEEEV